MLLCVGDMLKLVIQIWQFQFFFPSKYGNCKIGTAKKFVVKWQNLAPKKMMIRMFGKGMEWWIFLINLKFKKNLNINIFEACQVHSLVCFVLSWYFWGKLVQVCFQMYQVFFVLMRSTFFKTPLIFHEYVCLYLVVFNKTFKWFEFC